VQHPEIGIAIGPLMFAFGVGLIHVGRRLGKRDEVYMADHLKRTLEA
jgi:hypothetical protein